jgi:hypothetical protein
VINRSLETAIGEALGGNFSFDIYDILDRRLEEVNEAVLDNFLTIMLDNVYRSMQEFARGLEPQREAPVNSEGGLTELTRDFVSTIAFYGPKNPKAVELVQDLISQGFEQVVAEWIAYITSYMTYQVASKEGSAGEQLHQSLCGYYQQKYHDLGQFTLGDGTLLCDHQELYREMVFSDLQQAQALIHLASKARVDIFNAWTPLQSNTSKASVYLNSFVLPNLLFWQRLPQRMVGKLQDQDLLDGSDVKILVSKTARLTMIEAYALIIIGMKSEVSSMEKAREKLLQVFNPGDDLETAFLLNPKQGEAEIAQEIVYLWYTLQEEN